MTWKLASFECSGGGVVPGCTNTEEGSLPRVVLSSQEGLLWTKGDRPADSEQGVLAERAGRLREEVCCGVGDWPFSVLRASILPFYWIDHKWSYMTQA